MNNRAIIIFFNINNIGFEKHKTKDLGRKLVLYLCSILKLAAIIYVYGSETAQEYFPNY